MDFEQILKNALAWGRESHPGAHGSRHAAFANSVAYLTTGASGGYGGPTLREHAVSWSLTGDGVVDTESFAIPIHRPDGRIPRAGEWDYEAAIAFCDPICYGALPAICKKIATVEYFFDDDPEDLKSLGLE